MSVAQTRRRRIERLEAAIVNACERVAGRPSPLVLRVLLPNHSYELSDNGHTITAELGCVQFLAENSYRVLHDFKLLPNDGELAVPVDHENFVPITAVAIVDVYAINDQPKLIWDLIKALDALKPFGPIPPRRDPMVETAPL